MGLAWCETDSPVVIPLRTDCLTLGKSICFWKRKIYKRNHSWQGHASLGMCSTMKHAHGKAAKQIIIIIIIMKLAKYKTDLPETIPLGTGCLILGKSICHWKWTFYKWLLLARPRTIGNRFRVAHDERQQKQKVIMKLDLSDARQTNLKRSHWEPIVLLLESPFAIENANSIKNSLLARPRTMWNDFHKETRSWRGNIFFYFYFYFWDWLDARQIHPGSNSMIENELSHFWRVHNLPLEMYIFHRTCFALRHVYTIGESKFQTRIYPLAKN